MGIYSSNRIGSSVGVSKTKVGKYNSMEFGRIMYESECNDQKLFEAILKSDFREIQGLREGTLLESEIQRLNEASISEMIASLQERIKAFWQKIKKVFDNAITWISAYVAQNGKAFVKKFKARMAHKKKSWSGSEETELIDESKFRKLTIPPGVEAIERDIRSKMSAANKIEKSKVVGAALTSVLKTGGVSAEVDDADDYKTKATEAIFQKITVKAGDIDRLCGILETGSTCIKDLQASKKVSEKAIQALGKRLKKAERDASVESGTSHADIIRNINALVGAYETVISATSKTAIKAVQQNMKNSRIVLAKVLSDLNEDDEVQHNSAVLEAAEEFEDEVASKDGSDETPSEEVLDAAAEVIADALGEDEASEITDSVEADATSDDFDD